MRATVRRKFVDEVETIDLQTPEESYAVAEHLGFYRRVVEPALNRLSLDQREALFAYCHEDNLAQAARSKGVPYSTFRSRRDAAIRILRAYLDRT